MVSIQQIRRAVLIGRTLANRGKQNNYVRAGITAAKTVGASAKHASHLLFLQVTGSFFVFFTVIGTMAALHEYQRWHAAEIGPGRFYAAITFSIIFAYFGVSSFWQARKLALEKANDSQSR